MHRGAARGNIAAATILRARDEGLLLPAAAVLLTAELDLTESGDSFHANMGVDTVLTQSLMPANLLYAAGHDLTDPYVSPLFGDFAKGFPSTILTAGTRDLFLQRGPYAPCIAGGGDSGGAPHRRSRSARRVLRRTRRRGARPRGPRLHRRPLAVDG